MISAAGKAYIESVGVEPLPEGDALIDYWRNAFGEGERKVLDVVIAAWPGETSRAALAEQTGYSTTASTLNVLLGRLRTAGVLDGWRLADEFAGAVGLA